MDLFILDTNFDAVSVIDSYESLIWTGRYNEYGDFELYTPVRSELLKTIKQDYYLWTRDSDNVMIVEKIHIQSDAENGDHITVSGRSLESILTRRIIWGRLNITGNLQNGIKKLLDACIINPSDDDRKISNFIFEYSTDPVITGLTVTAQYTGDNLYDVISKLCSEHGIGFRITLNDNKQFVFKLYAGSNRSYDQNTYPYVIFSPNFENLLNSNYMESKTALKNSVLIAGEGEDNERKFASIDKGDKGVNRRELFVDARDISSDLGDGVSMPNDEYADLLKQRGNEKLTENEDVVSFEAQVDAYAMFKYGEDFFIGDIVQITNEFGHEATARICELVISENKEGIDVYPTFKVIQEGEQI